MEENKNELQTLEEDKNLIAEVKEKDNELIDNILQETNIDKLKDLTHLFNAYQTKRQILRVNALNDVQDALVAQMAARLQNLPNNFNNNDIAVWMKTVQQALDSTHEKIQEIDDTPTIVNQNNTQINVNVEDTLSKESREKIMDALQAILGSVKNPEINDVLVSDNEIQEESNTDENNLGEIDNYGNKEDSST